MAKQKRDRKNRRLGQQAMALCAATLLALPATAELATEVNADAVEDYQLCVFGGGGGGGGFDGGSARGGAGGGGYVRYNNGTVVYMAFGLKDEEGNAVSPKHVSGEGGGAGNTGDIGGAGGQAGVFVGGEGMEYGGEAKSWGRGPIIETTESFNSLNAIEATVTVGAFNSDQTGGKGGNATVGVTTSLELNGLWAASGEAGADATGVTTTKGKGGTGGNATVDINSLSAKGKLRFDQPALPPLPSGIAEDTVERSNSNLDVYIGTLTVAGDITMDLYGTLAASIVDEDDVDIDTLVLGGGLLTISHSTENAPIALDGIALEVGNAAATGELLKTAGGDTLTGTVNTTAGDGVILEAVGADGQTVVEENGSLVLPEGATAIRVKEAEPDPQSRRHTV